MKAMLKFFVYMGLIIVILYTSGCIYGDDHLRQQNADAAFDQAKENSVVEVGVLGSKSSPGTTSPHNTSIDNDPATPDTTTVVVYFADENNFLVAEKRVIPKVASIARQAMLELVQGPHQPGLYATVPTAAQLLDISIEDGLCAVNFNGQLKSAHSGGSSGENLTIYSIVNTLTQFATVDQVQILLEGQKIDTLAGHIDISVPLSRDDDLIAPALDVRAATDSEKI